LTGTATQAGAISELDGPRPLEKIGGGTLVLTGTNTYSGPTTVSGGALVVNGSIPNSTLTVDGGATLGGVGTIGNAIINNGTLSPGNSIGTITVNGNLVMTAAASYLVEISPTPVRTAPTSAAPRRLPAACRRCSPRAAT
jgi:autotransporter-associated beta strand protein